MPLAWVMHEPAAIMVHASGMVTFEESRVLQEQLLAHEWRVGTPMFVDARAMTGAPSAEELRMIALGMKAMVQRGLGPVAIVCGSSFIYGVARMFTVFAEVVHANVGAFRELDEAQEWLDTQPTAAA